MAKCEIFENELMPFHQSKGGENFEGEVSSTESHELALAFYNKLNAHGHYQHSETFFTDPKTNLIKWYSN